MDKQNSKLNELTPWQVFMIASVGITKMGLSDYSMIIFPSKAFILQCSSKGSAAITRISISDPPAEKQDTSAESSLQPFETAALALLREERGVFFGRWKETAPQRTLQGKGDYIGISDSP